MTIKEEVKHLLQTNVEARERRNRYRAVWYILHNKYYFDVIDKNLFMKIAPEMMSINRMFNLVQKQYTTLRGDDYDDGKILAQEKQIELGYEPGYNSDIRFFRKNFDEQD